MERQIATVFGLGNLRPAPGTWASAAAILLGVALHRIGHFPLLALATVVVTIIGFWAIRRLFAGLDNKDPSEFVIDEVAGQWLALCFPSAGFWLMGLSSDRFPYPGWLAAFIFFRLFDIWKPWKVGHADRRGDADGIMLDDLWAGMFAGVATMIAAGAAHGLFM
ncbi:phosphatidylglycerophosphatase A [Paracoccus sp. DMF-8]|uniref:phosphatidylglycerophosphatase A family protein n=1 Tax=Paracoccus sp. DMF-8 TaxID=3019445 RepID=UPI0023E812CC|nr:phosphatidylglycerophosphatase A [Paracoccus sp. DMF-8]MDF3606463.1 phosphatidylglycerophosphatase A [Paracoccus sp. DMF-8]